MSALGEAVMEYLALRRSLGYKLEAHGRLLPQFVAFLEHRQATVITTALALEWATQPAGGSVVWWHQRPRGQGKPRILRKLTSMDSAQRDLFELFGLDAFAPREGTTGKWSGI